MSTYKVFYLLLLLLLVAPMSLSAQDTIPPPPEVDTLEVDPTPVDTILVRTTQFKVFSIPRSATLTNPVITFKGTKPLSKRYKRFRVPSFWEKENKVGLSLSEVAFVNWSAGGDNSITGVANAYFARNYKFSYVRFDNELELKYGMNVQEGRKPRKTDDALRFESSFNYRRDTLTSWYYSAQLRFNTQLSNGYKYPDRENPISGFMAPGYLFIGAGTSYKPDDKKMNLYISPLTLKSTFVLNQDLANAGAFGVQRAVIDANGNIIEEGKNVYMELGFLITHNWEMKLYENMQLNHRLNLYTDYINSFGNIDVDWELSLSLKVNKYVRANLGTHLIYDDDILFDEVKDDTGQVVEPGVPKIQFKQVLGVGMVYDF